MRRLVLILAIASSACQPQKPTPGRWRLEEVHENKYRARTFLLDTATGRVWMQGDMNRWYEASLENRDPAPKPEVVRPPWESYAAPKPNPSPMPEIISLPEFDATPKPSPSASGGTIVNDDGSPARQ